MKRYICETRFDVLTAEDIVDALVSEGGIKNTFVNYIRMNRECSNIWKIELSDECKLFSNLDSPSEIRHRMMDAKYFELTCFKYSNAHYRKFRTNDYGCLEAYKVKGQAKVDIETYSTEEERIEAEEEKKDEIEALKALERKRMLERGENVKEEPVRKRKKKEVGPDKPPGS